MCISLENSSKWAYTKFLQAVNRCPPSLGKINIFHQDIVFRVFSTKLRYMIAHPCKIFRRCNLIRMLLRTVTNYRCTTCHCSLIKPFPSWDGYGMRSNNSATFGYIHGCSPRLHSPCDLNRSTTSQRCITILPVVCISRRKWRAVLANNG